MVRSPRRTVSGQIVERSTGVAAGLSRDAPNNAAASATTVAPAMIQSPRFRFCNKSGRAISITPCYSTCGTKEPPDVRADNKRLAVTSKGSGAKVVTASDVRVFDIGQWDWRAGRGVLSIWRWEDGR